MKIAVLDSLRSVHNVGSIFRTANACGIGKIILCGTTPTPLDKKGRKRSDFAKVALGAEDLVSWEYKETAEQALRGLKESGCYVVAIEQAASSKDYKEIAILEKENVAFIIGSEVEGVSEAALSLCDVVAEIPMLGTKESLNVSVAFGVAAYRMLGI
jgi:tRNA G18 (ribose-2'-O)-methylase SpoU